MEDKKTTEVLYGGGAGGGKSLLGCYWIMKSGLKYPGTRWLIGRKKLKNLKETTLNSFWDMCKIQNIPPAAYRYNAVSGNITLFNKSEILLKDLFSYPSDPEFDSLGSLEITGAFVDECNQITKKAKNIVKSRIRYKLKEFDLLPKWLGTCNPAKNWVYTDFYKLWQNDELPEYRRFVQALLSDNPHVSEHYKNSLLKLDKNSRERLLYGNWEYDDDPAALIKYDAILDLWTNTHVSRGKNYITADIAMYGADKFVVCVWSGFVLIELKVYDKTDGREIELILRQAARLFKVPQSRICYDADGLGAYLGGYLKNAKRFINNAVPIQKGGETLQYKNLKSQCYFDMARRINEAGYYIDTDVSRWEMQIIEELEQVKNHSYGTDDKLSVTPKSIIKNTLDRSPDFSDALMMREFFELKNIPNLSHDL